MVHFWATEMQMSSVADTRNADKVREDSSAHNEQ